MQAYSEDLRKKIVDAVERRGMGHSEAARTFDVSLSSVKRYVRKFRQGRSLLAGKAPGKRSKIDERARKLLEEDLKERRPFATLQQRCDLPAGRGRLGCQPLRGVPRPKKQMDSTRKKGWRAPRSETSGSGPPGG
jgi:transposase-like protein